MRFRTDSMNRRNTKRNVLTVVRGLETRIDYEQQKDSEAVTGEEMFNDLGTQIAGELISPASTSTSTVPTDTGFTGAAMGGNGWTFGGTVYHLVAVAAGVLQAGFNAAGKFLAGAGAVTLDASGIAIQTAASPTTVNSITWLNGAAGVASIYASNAGLLSINSIGGQVGIGGNSITIESATTIDINAGAKDVDTIIQGDTDANLVTVDGGLDVVAIGGVGVSGQKMTVYGRTALGAGGFLNIGTSSELTIATGAITVTQSYHTVDTQEDGASDDLDTISGGANGDLIWLRPEHTDRTVVVKDAVDNIVLNGDFTMDNVQKTICLLRVDGVWNEQYRSSTA